VIFERQEFIKQTADTVLIKNAGGKFQSYYWRAPFGSGKSVFLKLLGRELQTRDCEVYYLSSAKTLDQYSQSFFTQLAHAAGNKTVVLLIDEVQSNVNSSHWVPLLKVHPPNLLVLGVGLIRVDLYSPQFAQKYPEGNEMFPIFFNESDLPEIKGQFKKLYPDLPQSIVNDACEKILEYSAGQSYPFVAIVEHVLQKIGEESVDIDRYLCSKEFLDSALFQQVVNRCFSALVGTLLDKVGKYLLGRREASDGLDLQRLGIFRQGLFTSPFLTDYIFRMYPIPDVPATATVAALDDSGKTPSAEQIICAGLSKMKEEDFQDAMFMPKPPLGNAIGFRWGQNVRRTYPNLFFTSHSRTMFEKHCGPGAKPTIDFVFNGKLNLGIEIVLNGNHRAVHEHLSRFDGKYQLSKDNGIIFHIDTMKDEPTIHFEKPYESDSAKNRIYTFLKKRNVLYRGSTMVQNGVCKHLSTPLTRPYSTFAFGTHLRRVVKFL
jgi:hypothetical protein